MVHRITTPLTAALIVAFLSPIDAFKTSATIYSFVPRSIARAAAAAATSSTTARRSLSTSLALAMTSSAATTTTNGIANAEISKVEGATNVVKRIGIIGGGAAGLAAARAFLRANDDRTSNQLFDVTVLETRRSVGGVWKYDDDDDDDDDDETATTQSTTPEKSNAEAKTRPMYRNLRTNLPKELMAFRELPWGGDGEEASYVTHKRVQQYLVDYANSFDLAKTINYGCRVNHLKVLDDEHNNAGGKGNEEKKEGETAGECWPQISLQWTDADKGESHEQTFDNVCICNGHYALPSSPPLQGLPNFSGRVMHAIEYDDPKEFKGQTVLCVGARASGADIAREIGLVAKKVYLSDSTTEEMGEFGNVVLMPRTQSIDENGAMHFSSNAGDWTAKDVDVLIFCSGYDYSFPFINEDSNLDLKSIPGERRVSPLYEQLWHAQCPSLSFVGLPHSVVPFPCFEIQSTAIVSQLTGKDGCIPLPSLPERLVAAEADAKSGGPASPGRVQDTHFLGSYQWDYCITLAKIGGVYDDSMENFIATNKALYDRSGKERKGIAPGGKDLYRETRFRRVDEDQSFEVLHSKLEPFEA